MAIKDQKKKIAKSNAGKLTDEEIVHAYMNKLEHPLKAEIEAVRVVIKNANKKIGERIKWNAPSYYYKPAQPDESDHSSWVDLVTFNHRNEKAVHLVFHHTAIVKIKSDLLEGDYKDRRMTYFKDMKQVQANKKELEKIINALVKSISK